MPGLICTFKISTKKEGMHMVDAKNKIIVALDVDSLDKATSLVENLRHMSDASRLDLN